MSIGQLGPYRLEAELGRGGMATVYRAFHEPLHRYVALKVLDVLLSRNAEFQQRFEQEARVAAGLDHPNIIPIYDLGMADGHQYIAMRLIEGPTLEQVMRESGLMPAQRVLTVVAGIADALAYAHEQGIFHRDVKPSNIMLLSNDRPILTDFGIARAVEGLRLTMSQSIVGTPRYMSPEQARAQPVDGRSDIYSLGVVFYEMFSGQPPFTAPSTPSLLYMHVHESPPPLRKARPDLSADVREAVERCLAKAPEDRFQSAAEVAGTCRALLANPDLEASDATMLLPAQRPSSPPPHPGTPPGSQPAGPPSPIPSPGGPATLGGGPPGTPPPARRPDVPSAAAPTGRPPEAEPAGATMSAGAAGTPVPAGRRSVVPWPWVGGLVAALVLIAGLIVIAGDRLPGRSADTQAAAPPTAAAQQPAATAPPPAAEKGGPAASQAGPAAAAAPAAAASPAPGYSPAPAAPASGRLSDATAALSRRDYAAALEQANAGLKIDPKDPGLAKAAVQARLGYGQQLWGQGKLDEAMVHFLAVREQPLRAAASAAELREAELAGPYLWGELTWNVDKVTALAEYQKVYRIDPGYKDVRDKVYSGNIALAGQLSAQGDREGALRYLNAAKGVDPNRPEADAMFRSLTPTPSP